MEQEWKHNNKAYRSVTMTKHGKCILKLNYNEASDKKTQRISTLTVN